MDKKNDIPKGHLLAGTKILAMQTMGSMYDHREWIDICFELHGKKVWGRISTDTVMKMVNEFGFTLRKKRKYIHLEDPLLILDKDNPVLHKLYGFLD